jgi:uncharacterized SAM-binding protein YcdF (DUF218 family)
MSWLVTKLIASLLLPPLNLLLLCGAGLLLWRKRPGVARWLVGGSFVALWALSTPYVANGLLRTLERQEQPVNPGVQAADAIVVLGGGTYWNAPEYGGDTVNEYTLVRLRYAAHLARETGKPVLVSGGNPEGNRIPEGDQMKAVLENDFHVPVRWTENRSRNTYENAVFSYRVLSPLGIRRIYLVTHAWHMPRAAMAFRLAGFDVVPAATAFATVHPPGILEFVPDARALQHSRWFMHEILGLAWYSLKS